jgi:adenosylcobinamide-GDP ribazoletransferase
MLDRFRSTLSLVSRIPLKGAFRFDPSRTDFYLPVTGLLPAFLGFGVFWGSAALTERAALRAVLTLLVQYLAFNLFHLDGLADTADAFLGSCSRERRLASLKDSRLGVYGVCAAFADLGLKAALLAALSPLFFRFPSCLFAYPLTGRFGAALIPCMAKPARPGGLGALVQGACLSRCLGGVAAALLLWAALVRGLIAAVSALIPQVFTGPFTGFPCPALLLLLLPPAAGAPAALFFARLYRKGLDGYTGDALGAAVETGELLHLLIALGIARAWGFAV